MIDESDSRLASLLACDSALVLGKDDVVEFPTPPMPSKINDALPDNGNAEQLALEATPHGSGF